MRRAYRTPFCDSETSIVYHSEWMRSDLNGKMSAKLTKITRQVFASVDLNNQVNRKRHIIYNNMDGLKLYLSDDIMEK